MRITNSRFACLLVGCLSGSLTGCLMDPYARTGEPVYQDRWEDPDANAPIRGYDTRVEPARNDRGRYGRRYPEADRRNDDTEPDGRSWRDPDRRGYEDGADDYGRRRYDSRRRYNTGSGSIVTILDEHNRWRSQAGAPPLRWSDELADHAQRWADRLAADGCDLRHSQERRYGENLAWSRGEALSPRQVVNMWGKEVQDYSYDNNRCAPGRTCGHYTQVVWADTRELGCGTASCGNSEVWVCNYYPAGNFAGERPY